MMECVIRLQNIAKSFNGLRVLTAINLQVMKNEVVAILGPSGSGKTTLLRIIAGTLKHDSGEVQVSGRRIGYIFQDHRLLPWRTAQDNIALVLKAIGVDQRRAKVLARQWMDRMGLKGFYEYYPGQLSGGMVQRVSIARALAIEPEIILMDEPFSNLDTELVDSLLGELRPVIRDSHSAVVYVTHDPVEALGIADRMFLLNRGVLEEVDLANRQALIQNYCAGRLKNIADREQHHQ
jgi:NitT/TauT family transport system ATP-binding protein